MPRKRDRSWLPPAQSAHLPVPVASRTLGEVKETSGWSVDPKAGIAAFHPSCTLCDKPAMVWQRCHCGVVLARCSDHAGHGPGRGEVADDRAAHRKVCEGSGN